LVLGESEADYGKVTSMEKIYPINSEIEANAWIDGAKYEAMYRQSIDDNEGFWAEQGQRVD
jgi:acetyl-CoA synthetase